MSHRISEEELGYDATALLQEWFEGYMTRSDGRQYKVVQIEHAERTMVVEVQGTQHLDVEEEQFEIEVIVRRTDR
jgi:hypothetical protein